MLGCLGCHAAPEVCSGHERNQRKHLTKELQKFLARKLMGENLKAAWAEFSTLSWDVLLCVQLHGLYKYGRI